jgi:hypothetical protein
MKKLIVCTALATHICAFAATDGKLTGTPIGTERCRDYESNKTVLNTAYKLFDGDLSTYFGFFRKME